MAHHHRLTMVNNWGEHAASIRYKIYIWELQGKSFLSDAISSTHESQVMLVTCGTRLRTKYLVIISMEPEKVGFPRRRRKEDPEN